MEPLDPAARSLQLPPPVAGTFAPSSEPSESSQSSEPSESPEPPRPARPARPAGTNARALVPILPWRIGGALALSIAFLLMGWQVQRLVDDQAWSDSIMWMSILAGAVAAACVLVWTWFAALNARLRHFAPRRASTRAGSGISV